MKYINDVNDPYYCSKCNNIKRIQTNNERYGGNSPTCDPYIIDKIKKTNLEKWGSKNFNHSTEYLERLVSSASNKYKLKIISYSDNSISNGDIYKKLGFIYSNTSINYYWSDGNKKYHRFKFNKKKLINEGFDKSKTELEIMRNRGFNRIWRAGNKKWIYKNNIIY